MHRPVILLALLPVLAGSGQDAQEKSAEDGLVPPEVAQRAEDYAQARSQFHTHLLREGPAPPRAKRPAPPAGVTEVEFPSGALSLHGWMSAVEDPGGTKRAAIVFLHGGFAFGSPDWDMTAMYRDAGFVVLAPMLRGENGQPGNYSLFYDEVEDVLAAGRYLQAQPFVDAAHVYVAGHSVGGTLALLAAMSAKTFRKAASFSASPDQVIYCRLGIAPEDVPFDTSDPHEFEMRSPLAFARSFKIPARLYFGSEEPHFRLSTERTAELARAAKLDVEAVRVEGDHFSAVPAAMEASIEFFEQE